MAGPHYQDRQFVYQWPFEFRYSLGLTDSKRPLKRIDATYGSDPRRRTPSLSLAPCGETQLWGRSSPSTPKRPQFLTPVVWRKGSAIETRLNFIPGRLVYLTVTLYSPRAYLTP
ncbi:hypothetical protein PM082_009484 [Marasmius tenuissimus]|nr:hypothetical protein PM082_009484 [Marasmius tenuissimus]